MPYSNTELAGTRGGTDCGRAGGRVSVRLVLPEQQGDLVRCRVAWPAPAPMLADVVPLFEQFGRRVADHPMTESDGSGPEVVALDVFGLQVSGPDIDVMFIRAAFRYLRQATLAYSQPYVENMSLRHAEFVRGSVDLVTGRLNPEATSASSGR